MKKAFFLPLQVSFCTVGYLCTSTNLAQAQVTTDGTVNTQVNQNGTVAEITGGETRGSNLFHSFQDFSVPTGNEAFFDNASDIANIFSRVTGGNISNIDGLIRANDSASLFLINPAGIVFGNNARLDIGGSFYGSSANSILFENGEFSAVDLDNPPLLTVNAPIGLGFRDEPEDITNRSFARDNAEEFVGLEVNAGNTLALVGGDINFEAGEATAKGGNIYLGGLKQSGVVDFTNDGSLSFPESLTLADITLSNGSDVDVRGSGGGNININAQNLTLTPGEFGSSFIRAGIAASSTTAEAQAGDIAISVADKIPLNNSRIVNQVNAGGIGNSGNVNITAGFIELINGGDIDASTFGIGDAGAVNVTATGDITIDGEDSGGFASGITSLVNSGAEGNSGGVIIETNNLNLFDGGRVDASTFGIGDAGAVNVTATGDITAEGEKSGGFASGITSLVNSDAEGSSGGVIIETTNLNLTNGGRIDASTFSTGDAGAVKVTARGDITAEGENSAGVSSFIDSRVESGAEGNSGGVTIETTNLSLSRGGRIAASTLGTGNAGAVSVTATGDITAEGEDSQGSNSGITSLVNFDAKGNSGGVTIETTNLSLSRGGRIATSTFGIGDAGTVKVTARGDITIDGEDSGGFVSGITSSVNPGAEGNSGGVKIETNNLNLIDGSRVSADTFGTGNAGAVNVTATGDITAEGENSEGFGSSITSFVNPNAKGNSGGVKIETNNLNLSNGGRVDASTFGTGDAGELTVKANFLNLNNNARINASTISGLGGIINLQIAENITLDNNSFISAQAFENANGGNLNIDTRYIIAFPSNGIGNDLVATAEAGRGGNINLNAEQVFGLSAGRAVNRQTNTFLSNSDNDIDVSGNVDGNLNIDLTNIDPLQGTTELPNNLVQTEQTSIQACRSNRDTTAKNGLSINGKGGVTPDPNLPLSSLNVATDNEINSISAIPAPIKTSQGKIKPARGIKVSESGKITLTAYRTNNAGSRISDRSLNCGKV